MRKYDFALSFAKEDRQYAEKLADLLATGGYSVFYDKYEQAQLLGKDLYQHLSSVYKDQAHYCVIFLSKHYARKLWTKHELQSAQARAFQESREYILPIRLDDTEIAGILPTVGHIDLREMDIERAYHVLLAKLSGTASQGTTIDTPTAAEYYFQSLKSFELRHFKKAQECHVYLKAFVAGTARKESIKSLVDFAEKTNGRVLLIHSQGGIGKTRFVLESLKQLKEQNKTINILFNRRQRYVNVSELIPEITEEQESLIVFDDAHLIDNLTDFENILLERNLAKIILITRSTAKESVKQSVSYPAEEMELTPLNRESSIELLKGNLEKPLRDEHLRYAAQICEGNPLLIGIATHLIGTGTVQSFGALKTDKLIKNHLETILAELKQSNWVDRHLYEPYLAMLFLLRPFAVNDAETRSLIRSHMDINENQEGRLLLDLEQCAVLERHGSTLWLYPDLLGEYLVKTTFFEDTRIQNFDEIFSKIPSSYIEGVFRTLRELDNALANRFLKGWARDLSRDVESQDNDERSDNLRLLEIIASIVPDETLEIIDYLLKPESEKPPKAREYMWSPTPRKHRDVLSQCLRILKNPDFKQENLDETLETLLAMHFYKPDVEIYSSLRKDAYDAVVSVAAYDLTLWYQESRYSIPTTMFEKAQKWKQDDLKMYLLLILGVCRNLLQPEMKSEYADSEGIGWAEKPVVVNADLVRLRENVICLLQLIFDEVQGPQRIEVIHALNCATEFPTWGQYGEDIKTMIQDNAKVLVNFYLSLMSDDATLEVKILQEIEKQAYHLKTWKAVDISLIRRLQRALQSHECYQLYKTLAGDASLFWREEGKSYDEAQTETTESIKEFANAITHENLIEWFEKIDRIAETFTDTLYQDKSRFNQLLFEIGESKPDIAQILIDKSITEGNALKRFAAEFIRGIRKSDCPSIAQNYVRQWLSGEDKMLLSQVPNAYWTVDEESLDVEDVENFETLQNCRMEDEKQRQELDRSIMSNIRWIYKENPVKTSEIICQIVKRSDQRSIGYHIHELWRSRAQIQLSQWDLKAFEVIIHKLVYLPSLDHNAVNMLAQYGQKAPLKVVGIFERRLEKMKQLARDKRFQYHPIPHFLKELAELYRDHPQLLEIVNQILRWFQKADYYYDTAAADLISGISPEINDRLRMALSDFIHSASRENILAAMKLLEEYPDDPVSDELYEEIVKHSANDRELQKDIKSRLLSVGEGRLQYWRQRFKSWLAGDEIHLREFAQRAIEDLESLIEFYELRTAEDKIKRKKGLM